MLPPKAPRAPCARCSRWDGRVRAAAPRRSQDVLLGRIPALGDLQAAWLQLLFCMFTRATCFLRMLPSHCTADCPRDHDRAALCLRAMLSGEEALVLPADALAAAPLPLGLGGL